MPTREEQKAINREIDERYKKQEQEAAARAAALLRRIEEQIRKRHYLNAAGHAASLSREILAALSAVLKTSAT